MGSVSDLSDEELGRLIETVQSAACSSAAISP